MSDLTKEELYGDLKEISYPAELETKLDTLFKAKFRGRSPQILPAICSYISLFEPDDETGLNRFVQDFNINNIKNFREKNNLSALAAVVLSYQYSNNTCRNMSENMGSDILTEIAKGHIYDIKEAIKNPEKHDNTYRNALIWCATHPNTDPKILFDVLKHAKKKNIDEHIEDLTVDGMKAQIERAKAYKEIKKLEKTYKKPHFKFSEVTCELKNVGEKTENDKYSAYIMTPNDPRQVMLGYSTFCCQKADDAGESAMMHGLLNPKAGFFIIEDKITKEIKAQGEIWEENENTLVFDNIEFANDADINLYKEILKDWLEKTDYKNVKAGTGYNGLIYEGSFRSCGPVTPTITAREAYVASYEPEIEIPNGDESLEELSSEEKAQELLDSGRITYFTYIYCDSENGAVWFKDNGRLEPYFAADHSLEQIVNAAKEPDYYPIKRNVPNVTIEFDCEQNDLKISVYSSVTGELIKEKTIENVNIDEMDPYQSAIDFIQDIIDQNLPEYKEIPLHAVLPGHIDVYTVENLE